MDDEIRDILTSAQERVRDRSLDLLRDAVYRKDDKAKALERQCAKIDRALAKAIHEFDALLILENKGLD